MTTTVPTAVFNVTPLPEFMQRVQEELNELVEKRQRLEEFIYSEAFAKLSENSQELLTEQSDHMYGYINVLRRRIELFLSEL